MLTPNEAREWAKDAWAGILLILFIGALFWTIPVLAIAFGGRP